MESPNYYITYGGADLCRDSAFVGPSYANASVSADDQACINFYPEIDESGAGNSPIILLPTPGLKSFVKLAVGLSIAKTHVGSFVQGERGATYSIIVSNAGPAPSFGLVTVNEAVPAGMTLVSMAGSGWTVIGNVASRSDSLAASTSYPTLTVTVNVSCAASSPLVNTSTLQGGGLVGTVTATDSTAVLTWTGGTVATSINAFGSLGSHTSFTVTVTAGPQGIKIGDFGLLLVQAHNNTAPTVAAMSDSLGNSWTTPGQGGGTTISKLNTTGLHDYINLCSAPMQTAVMPGGTFTITFAINIVGGSGNSTVNDCVFVNCTGVTLSAGFPDVRTGGGTSAVNLTTLAVDTPSNHNDFYLAFAYPGPGSSITVIPTGFTSIPAFTSTFQGAYYINSTSSTVNGQWTQSPAAGFGVFLLGFTAAVCS